MGKNTAASAGEGKIEEFVIFSNDSSEKEKKLDIVGGLIELIITESILDNSVRARYTYADVGHGEGRTTASDEKGDINLSTSEKCHLVVSDGFGNKIVFKDDYHLRVKNRGNKETTRNSILTLDFYSEESIKNTWEETRVIKSFDGKITNHVYDILKNILKTPKNVSGDPGLNNFVFTGKTEMPFYVIPWLAKRCIPDFGPPGKYAGYFFYEVSDNGSKTGGYRFKSIDVLTQQTPKLKLSYTDTTVLPIGYDMGIVDYSFNNNLDLEKILKTGSYVPSKLKTFSPYSNEYKETVFNDFERLTQFNLLGQEIPKIGTDLDLINKSTRISTKIKQDDVSNTGKSLKDQLEVSKGKYINYPEDQIINQSRSRYNNLFNIRLSITIPGRFDLHAGDLVHCDFPEVSSKKTQITSEKKSGLYMIVDVGHRISKNSCYTTLNLTRESIYRKGSR